MDNKTEGHYYATRGWDKYAVEDSYEQGEIGEGGYATGKDTFEGTTLEAVIKQGMLFFGIDEKESVEVNADDVPGRVRMYSVETAEGYPATKNDIELWKKNRKKIWSVTYTFYVKKIISKQVVIPKRWWIK